NAGERGISLGLAELPDFTAPNADPSHSTRNGGPSAVGLSFAPRLEAAQQLPQLPITLSPGHRGWAAEVGNQVSWMVGRSEARAELQLTPPSLGKLGVSIQVNGDQTTAQFVAASQAARDALEQAMPRLREVLQQAGIELGETHVSTSHEQSSARDDESAPRAGNFTRNDDAEAPASPLNVPPIRSGSGLVDTFA
ncbi:MAG TPA: flagellar hook-length control protein FliK, partial [Azoarcus sp.]|nr:flagellar hook-length control protein FliK [Azoarcus sp.]